MSLLDFIPRLAVEDETELPGDDIAADELAEWSFENAQDEYEAREAE